MVVIILNFEHCFNPKDAIVRSCLSILSNYLVAIIVIVVTPGGQNYFSLHKIISLFTELSRFWLEMDITNYQLSSIFSSLSLELS